MNLLETAGLAPLAGGPSILISRRARHSISDLLMLRLPDPANLSRTPFAWLEAQWNAGLHNGAELWRQLRLAGFGAGLRVVTEWATRRRQIEKAESGLAQT